MNFIKAFVTAATIVFAASALYAQAPAAVGKPDAATARLRLEAFEKVWNTVNENHFDPAFGGIDWKKAREDFLPKAKAAVTDDEFNNVLRQMLARLKLSHFGVFSKEPAIKTGGNAGIAVELKMIGSEPVIARVEPGGAAAAAGLAVGWTVNKIGGKAVAELLRPLEASFAGRQMTDAVKMLYRQRVLEALFTGPVDSKILIEAADGAGIVRAIQVVRSPFAVEMSQPMGYFPAQPVVFESKLLTGNIGYIRFNIWVVPQMAKIRAAIREFAGTDGLILDLRGNPGGVGGMAAGVAGLLLEKQVSLGRMTMRGGALDFVAYPQPSPFPGPIAILTDYGSASTSEVFAAGLQELGRATIVGEMSAGAVLPSVIVPLPTGAMFQYAVADYRSPKNVLVEGRGVTPDIAVAPDRKAMIDGRDVQLEAAIKSIKQIKESNR